MKQNTEVLSLTVLDIENENCVSQVLVQTSSLDFGGSLASAMICPNCGAELEGRKCKLLCLRAGCGYQVTCAEW